MDVSNTRRIVMLGKTGAGKSSSANTIFEGKLFKITHPLNSTTSECRAETKLVNGRSITLIDTPDFFDTDRPEEEMKCEIVRCITECAPGPHVFLIVLKVEKFTEHEQDEITKISQYFSEEVFKYATVVFTHGDQFFEGQTIEDFVHQNMILCDLVNKCGGRCHIIDNKYWKNNQQDEYKNNQFQVKKLLKTIDMIVEASEGRCYTNEMLQAVDKEIQQQKECIRQSGNMSEEEITEQAKGRVSQNLSSKLADAATGTLLSAFFGVMMGEAATILLRRAGALKMLEERAAQAVGAESVLMAAVKGGDARYDAVSNTKTIVMLGKTGTGKSSMANTIFGQELFKIAHGLESETRECQAETQSVNGRSITLIDTPGFFDTDRSEEKAAIVRCITECAPGPHVFLIVLKVEKITEHERAVITKICQYFSEEVFKYAIVVFTHGDQLFEGQSIEEFVHHHPIMSDLVNKCGSRCHVVDNKYWKNNQQDKYRSNQFQVEELLKTIDKTFLANNRRCYTNEILRAVEDEIQQQEECIRQSGNMSVKEIREQAKGNVFNRLLIKLAGAATGALLSAFFGVMKGGVDSLLMKGAGALKKLDGMVARKALGAVGAGSVLMGAVKGGNDGAEREKTLWGALRTAALAVKNKAQSISDEAYYAQHRHPQGDRPYQ